MRLGVDFGTTNSSIALYDGDRLHTIVADRANDNPYVMPSLLYVDRKRRTTVGAKAAEVYLKNETGRPVRWRQREAGEIEVTVASVSTAGGDPIQFVQPVNVMVDEAANGRLIQSIKTALFNPRYEGTRIFNRFYPVETLIASILKHLREAAERELGRECRQIVLGRPVRFSEIDSVDARAEAVLFKAAHLAGFTDVVFELEPVGVAYLYHRQNSERQTVLVFDFGGGTLDLTIARVGGTETPEILATGGVQFGGDDLDRRIMESLLPYFGGGDDGVLPPEMSDKLLAWQTMPDLSRPRYVEQIQRLKRSGHGQQMLALETLISHNIGFKLFKEIERVKKQLSTDQSAAIQFSFENIQIDERISRRRFNRMIADDLELVKASVQQALANAKLNGRSIDTVLRTGGSSLIPAFRHLLEDIFDHSTIQSVDPLISVTGGFAVVGHDLSQRKTTEVTAPQSLITDIRVLAQETNTLDTYNIELNAQVFSDRNFTVNRIPPYLNRMPAVRMVNSYLETQAEVFLMLRLARRSRVYIGYESTARQLPDWLREFSPEPVQIEIEDTFALIKRTHQIYSKVFEAGEVILGGNQAAGYAGDVITHYIALAQPLAEATNGTHTG